MLLIVYNQYVSFGRRVHAVSQAGVSLQRGSPGLGGLPLRCLGLLAQVFRVSSQKSQNFQEG